MIRIGLVRSDEFSVRTRFVHQRPAVPHLPKVDTMSFLEDAKRPLKRLLTVPEAAFGYGISRSKFYEEVAAGRIPLRKCGRRTLVAADDMELATPLSHFHPQQRLFFNFLAQKPPPRDDCRKQATFRPATQTARRTVIPALALRSRSRGRPARYGTTDGR